MRPKNFAEAESVLASNLPGYESRPQQEALAVAIETAISERKHLLAEAGTGTGKSLGYLIPAILSGRRVVVATATKALQNQVWEKDIPFLQAHLGAPFSAALLKGRSNYLCYNKLADADPADVPHLAQLIEFAGGQPCEHGEVFQHTVEGETCIPDSDEFGLRPNFSGEKEDLPFEVEWREWMKIAADTDDCGTYKCNKNFRCYASRAKWFAHQSDIVVVNHALYMKELYVRDISDGFGTLLGEHDVAIFDEAHEMEEYATSALGFDVKEVGIRMMLAEVTNLLARNQSLSEKQLEGEYFTSEVTSSMARLWDIIEDGRIKQDHLLDNSDHFVNFSNSLWDLHEFVDGFETHGLDQKVKNQVKRLEGRTRNTANNIVKLITDSFDDSVRWVETDNKGNKVINFAPINVGPYLRRLLFNTRVTCVLVSATLAIRDSFDYIAGRLGVDEYDSLDVGTPFDYETQAQTFVPIDLPEPSGDTRAAWSSQSVQEMLDLVRKSEGRALLLFTSFTEMRGAYDLISSRVPYRCMMQGEAPNKVLAEDFAADENSILFATRSFMTGVDFQGDTLKLVVINKLPFPVPTDPIIEARCESIKRAGKSDFTEYTIPVMSLILKQAYGRLIRHRNDRGVVAILDPRLETKGYGKGILRSLPPAPVVHRLDEVNFNGRVTV